MQQRGSQITMEDETEDRTSCTSSTRGRQSNPKLKVLVRSHAMREETSPPREPSPNTTTTSSSHHHVNLSPCIKVIPSTENFPVDLTTTISPSSPNALLRLSPTLSRQSTPCSRSPVCVSPTSTLVPSSPTNSRCSPVQNLQNFSLSPNSSSTQLYGCGQQVQQQACCSGDHDEERSAEECESFSSTASPKYNTGSNRHSSEKDLAAKQRDYNATTQAASHNTISHNNINNKKKLVCDCPSTATSTNQQSQQQQQQSQHQTVAVAPSVCIKCAKNQLQQEQRNMNNNNLTNVANNNNNNNNNINNNNSVATSVGSSNSTNTNSNTLTVSRISSSHHHVHHNRGKLRQQSSSQGSFEGSSTGNSPCLSRDSSSELQYYTDTSGTDLEIFIPDTLNRNAKDRAFMLRIEQELVNLAKDKIKTHFKFPPMSSYQRMLVHRCAAYFGMEHNLESSGKCVVVNKTKNTRIPDIEFKEHVKEDIIFSNISDEQPRRSILKRDSNSCEEYGHHFKSPDRQYGGGSFESNRRSKSFEEREEAYEKVRRRIFNREMHDSNSNEDFEWAELPWSSTESDNPRFRLQLPEHNRRHAGKLIKVLSEETGETHRPCVAKSYSFGGYAGVLNRGDSIVSTHSAGPRLLTKQDSGASSVSWRLSPSSSGYKSQSQMSQMSESVTPSPTSTPHPPGDCGTTVLTPDGGGGGGGGRQDSSSSETSGGRLEKHHSLSESSSTSSAVVWAITDLQNVPKGCPIINPQTGETIKNDDGTLYLYDPGNPPREFVSILSKPPPSPKRNPASCTSPQQKSSSASCSSSTTSITTATSTSTRETTTNNNTNTNSNTTRSQSPRKHVQRSSKYPSSSSPAHHNNNSSASSHSYSSAHHYNNSLSGSGNPNQNAKSYHVTNSSTSPSLPYSPPVMSAHHHHHHQNQRNSCFQFISNMNEVMQQQQFASATMYNPAYPPPPPHETLPPQPVYQHAPCILYAAAPYGLPVSPHYEGRMEQIPEIGGTYYMTIPESASAAAVPPVQSMTYHQQAAPAPSPYWNQQPTIAYYHPPSGSSATPPQRYPVQAQTGYLPAATSYSQTYLPPQPGSQQQPPVLPPGNDLVPVYPHPHHHHQQQQQVQLVYSTTTPQPNQAAPSAGQMMYHPGGAATNQNAAGGASVLFTASTPQGPSSSSSGAMYPSSHQQMMYPPQQQPQPLLSQQPQPPPPPQGCLPPYPPNTPTPNSCTSSVSQSASSTSAFAGHLEGMHHQQQQQQQHQMVMQQVAQNMAQMTFVQQHGHQSGVVPAGAMVQGAPPSSLLQHHQQQAFPLPPGPGAVTPSTMIGGVANNKMIPSGAAPPYVDCISSGNSAASGRPNKKKFGGGPPKQFTMMSSNHSQSSTGTSSPSAASTVVPVVAGATGGYPVSVAMPPQQQQQQQQQQQAQQQPMMMTYHSSNRTPSETPPNNNGASGQQFGGYSPAGCPPIPSMFFRQMSNIRASTPCTNKSSRSPTPASDISQFDKPRLPLPSTIYHGMPYVIQSSDSRIVSGRGQPNPYRHSAPVRQQSFSQSGDNRSHKNRKPKGSKPSSGQPSNNNGGKPL